MDVEVLNCVGGVYVWWVDASQEVERFGRAKQKVRLKFVFRLNQLFKYIKG